jgi:hypothetical protein
VIDMQGGDLGPIRSSLCIGVHRDGEVRAQGRLVGKVDDSTLAHGKRRSLVHGGDALDVRGHVSVRVVREE